MESRGLFSLRTELQGLKATKPKTFRDLELKGAITQSVQETLAKAVDMAFYAADTGVNRPSFGFTEIALTDMARHVPMNEVILKSFERRTQSEKLVSRSRNHQFPRDQGGFG